MNEEELTFVLKHHEELKEPLARIYGSDAILRATGHFALMRVAWERGDRSKIDAHNLHFEVVQCMAGKKPIIKEKKYDRQTFAGFLQNISKEDGPGRLVGWIASIEYGLRSSSEKSQKAAASFLKELLGNRVAAPAVRRILDLRFSFVREESREQKTPIESRWPAPLMEFTLKRHEQYGEESIDGLIKDIIGKGQVADKQYLIDCLERLKSRGALLPDFEIPEMLR